MIPEKPERPKTFEYCLASWGIAEKIIETCFAIVFGCLATLVLMGTVVVVGSVVSGSAFKTDDATRIDRLEAKVDEIHKVLVEVTP